MGTVALSAFGAAAYLAGRNIAYDESLRPARQAIGAPAALAPPPAPIKTEGSPAVRTAERGKLYLQVAAVDRGVAEVFVEVLQRKGIVAVVAAGPSEDIFRVLVGPIDKAELEAERRRLESAGFSCFPRRI